MSARRDLHSGKAMILAGLVGGSGYTAAELIRLLAAHPGLSLHVIASRSPGQCVGEVHPSLRHVASVAAQPFEPLDAPALSACDVVFFATPHGVAMRMAPALLDAGVRVVDLSADFRLRDPALWERWYGEPHLCPERLDAAVYGLPEMAGRRDAIAAAALVACPGCYPTAAQLGLAPLIEEAMIDTTDIVVNAVSGVSGAGRRASAAYSFMERSDNFCAYGVDGHRHLPEIEQGLADAHSARDAPVQVTFVPHLAPMRRGIHATMYAKLSAPEADLHALYRARYRDEPFVSVAAAGDCPDTAAVSGANVCSLSVCRPPGAGRVVVLAVIDNLVKGAAGQAVQNMNIMHGLPETAGLQAAAPEGMA